MTWMDRWGLASSLGYEGKGWEVLPKTNALFQELLCDRLVLYRSSTTLPVGPLIVRDPANVPCRKGLWRP
jgi:hypothetical protein